MKLFPKKTKSKVPGPVRVEGDRVISEDYEFDEKSAAADADKIVHDPKNYSPGSIPTIGSGRWAKRTHKNTRAIIRSRNDARREAEGKKNQQETEAKSLQQLMQKRKSFRDRLGL